MSLIDLTGRRFGRLVVIQREGSAETPSGQRQPTWLCRCDCGTEKVIRGMNLRSGAIVSCGCHNRAKSIGTHDAGMVGARFGRYVVIERAGTAHNAVTWRCICDCGTERIVRGFALRRGMTQSCGCLALENATKAKIKPVVKYLSAHDRVTKERGRAKALRCVDCDGAAREWSYDGGDPNELTELVHGRHLLAYSLDVSRYSPRCRSCHRRFDAAKRKEGAA